MVAAQHDREQQARGLQRRPGRHQSSAHRAGEQPTRTSSTWLPRHTRRSRRPRPGTNVNSYASHNGGHPANVATAGRWEAERTGKLAAGINYNSLEVELRDNAQRWAGGTRAHPQHQRRYTAQRIRNTRNRNGQPQAAVRQPQRWRPSARGHAPRQERTETRILAPQTGTKGPW